MAVEDFGSEKIRIKKIEDSGKTYLNHGSSRTDSGK